MDSSSSSLCCPGCQRPLEPGRAQGLCPRCLLARAAFATEAEDSPPLSPAPDLPTVAAAFPQLEVLELIGRGGMGVVYRARQKSLNRPVALKLLAPGRERDPAFAGRFAREARALAALNHPNIVTVHDFGFAQSASAGEAGGFYFLLMEFVDGVNLRQAMKAGRFTPEQALAIVPPVCTALQFAHERGIVHRDIKPENLLLDKDGRIKIADFGIAKMLGTDDGGRRGDASPSTSPDVSGEGNGDQSLPTSAPTQVTAAGTPQYMAPEQRDPAGRSDHRADIYSLGVVLYELLTGELPGVRLQPPSHKVQLDVRLDEIVLRALAVQPELRFATAAEFRTRLDTVATRVSGSAGTGPGSGHLPRLLKSSGGLLYRPEELDTVEGQFCVWKRRGQLVLDEQRLTFVRGDQQTVVPLAAIRDVSVGGFPRSMNPAGVDLVSVTFEEGGRNRRLLLAPMDGWFAWPATWNERVADWAAALRHAVAAAAGKEPAATLRERLPRAGRGGVGLLISLSYVVPLLALLALLGLKRTPSPGDGTLFVVVCGFFAVLWMMPGQAGTRCRSPRRIWGILLLLAALGVGMISLERQVRHRRVMAETQQTALARLRDALEQEEAIRKQLAEWTRRTANPADETQRSHDQIGRSRLQRELDSSAQRRLELERTLGRGVPQPDHSGPLWAMPPLLLGGLWLLLRPGTGTSPDAKPRRWMQWLGGVCLLLGVPLAGFAAWIGLQVAQDSSWNPTPAEAFTTVAVGLGSVLLLGGGVTLLAFARPGSRSGTMVVPVIATLLAGLAFLGVTWIYTRAHYAPTGQPFP